eukprot:82052-Rhodomonas_salina.2
MKTPVLIQAMLLPGGLPAICIRLCQRGSREGTDRYWPMHVLCDAQYRPGAMGLHAVGGFALKGYFAGKKEAEAKIQVQLPTKQQPLNLFQNTENLKSTDLNESVDEAKQQWIDSIQPGGHRVIG